MTGYVRRIAVIKQIKGGFSADGSPVSGLVKAEAYAGFLKVEISLINFAPLSEGRYIYGISDGERFLSFEDAYYECETDFDLTRGFAAVICFCKNGVFPVASAFCGDRADALIELKTVLSRQENVTAGKEESAYEDEAIAEVNYFEFETYESGGTVREDKEKKTDGCAVCENEETPRPVKDKAGGVDETKSDCAEDIKRAAGGKNKKSSRGKMNGDMAEPIKLADGDFYKRMEKEIENIFSSYPAEEGLCAVVEGSRWAKINYGVDKYYVFGVIYEDKQAAYVCYGVPSKNGNKCPESLTGRASYIPVDGGGYWVMYQDARTGVSVPVSSG